MHAHRNGRPPDGLPALGSPAYLAERTAMAELVITPPEQGDSIAYLIDRLPLPPGAVEPAVDALQRVGLVERHGDFARATTPAKYFEHLWPAML